ncbi:prepilin-type N-terminal cleavage/methylation domain-containing protein [Bacillus salitolerans]|uniref:Prepilin-type N-terminal cleavage/methylation domain-containing protein n=1 Tax=Bacillus salitolerans TaxID=1437434 RepID=A0ABW4LLG9_9BACI
MWNQQNGMTLFEVLAAIVILSIIAIVLMNSMGFTSIAFSKSDKKVEAILIAETELKVKLHELEIASPPINVCTTSCTESKSVNRNGHNYHISIIETSLTQTPAYNYSSQNPYVSMQGIAVMYNGTSNEQRLITVVVDWER